MVGQKAIVKLAIMNNFPDQMESARAVYFLMDDQGKMVGQSAKWVIGGTKGRPALEPKAETIFNFVISSAQPFTTTNLTAKVSFSRLALAGGQLVNVQQFVSITAAAK